MKKAIVIGATSGIGKGLAKLLADNNYRVGITKRRAELLNGEKIKLLYYRGIRFITISIF